MKNEELFYVEYEVVGWWKTKGKRKKHILFNGRLGGNSPTKLKIEIDRFLSLFKKDDPRKVEFSDVYHITWLCKLKHLHCPS
jgi:hypothetical protein